MGWFDIIKFNVRAFKDLFGDNAYMLSMLVGNPPSEKLFRKIPWFAESFIIDKFPDKYNVEEIVNNPEKLIELAAVYDINLKDPSELNMLMTYLKSKGIEPVM